MKPAQLEKRREKNWKLSECGAMMNIKWMDRITNEEVLGRIGQRRKNPVEESEEEKRSDDGAHTETRGIA